jgi:hypothetical protein
VVPTPVEVRFHVQRCDQDDEVFWFAVVAIPWCPFDGLSNLAEDDQACN